MTIPLMRHTFLNEAETLDALSAWLATRPTRLSMDTWCARFEREFASWQGRKHAVLFNSGASANLATFQALINLGLRPRARVGFSALTWATNVMPLLQLGFRTIPVDVDPCTLNVMAATLRPLIERIDVMFITNALGYLPDLDAIRDLCAEHEVLLIEDNCESLGSELPAGKAGNFGKASTFSFFVAHHMSTIEGGMVCTDDDRLAEMLRMVRANGWDRNLTADQQRTWRDRYGIKDELEAKYTFYVQAYNLRPTEITGFLGVQQLRLLDQNIRERAAHFEALEAVAQRNPDLLHLERDHMSVLSPFAFPVVCQSAELRDRYIESFAAASVEIRPIIAGNIAKQPFYRAVAEEAPTAHAFHSDTSGARMPPILRGADQVERCGFYFGIYPELTAADLAVLSGCLSGEGLR